MLLHLECQPGLVGPAPLFLTGVPSDMVTPSSVTSRLGSVFPFLLVLVDLQYEGESCSALARGAGSGVRPPGASPPAPGRVSWGSPGGGARAGDSPAGPGPELAPRRGPAPGSGFVSGRSAGTGGHGARDCWFGVTSRGEGIRGNRAPGSDFWSVLGRGDAHPWDSASLGTLSWRLGTLLVSGAGRRR